MLLKNKKKRGGGEIPTASLPDIVFMLLLFFLVTTTIDMDKGLGMVLPDKGESVEVHKKNITNILVSAVIQFDEINCVASVAGKNFINHHIGNRICAYAPGRPAVFDAGPPVHGIVVVAQRVEYL